MENGKSRLTIAVDGHSSCGKSTLAKAVAKKLNYAYLDSGAMYRGITLYATQNGLIKEGAPLKDELKTALNSISLSFKKMDGYEDAVLHVNGVCAEPMIRSMKISSLVSKIAEIKEVRNKLVEEQRKMGEQGGVVMDGRDIGSVVFPNAELKLFVTANVDVRAQRRFDELKSKGDSVSIDEVKANLEERDHIDSTREESPLIKTEDAITLDNSSMTREEQCLWVLDRIREIS